MQNAGPSGEASPSTATGPHPLVRRSTNSTSLLYLRFVLLQPVASPSTAWLFQPVDRRQVSTLTWLRPRAFRWTSFLNLRFLLLQPVEATLEVGDALLEMRFAEIRLQTLDMLEMRLPMALLEMGANG